MFRSHKKADHRQSCQVDLVKKSLPKTIKKSQDSHFFLQKIARCPVFPEKKTGDDSVNKVKQYPEQIPCNRKCLDPINIAR